MSRLPPARQGPQRLPDGHVHPGWHPAYEGHDETDVCQRDRSEESRDGQLRQDRQSGRRGGERQDHHDHLDGLVQQRVPPDDDDASGGDDQQDRPPQGGPVEAGELDRQAGGDVGHRGDDGEHRAERQ